MARENGLWAWLKKAKLHFQDKLSLGRLENSVGSGWPDVEGYLEAWGQIWIELKSAPRPARISTAIRPNGTVREAQINWLNRRWNMGQRVFMLIQVGEGPEGRRYLLPGHLAQQVHDGQTEGWLANRSWCSPTAKPVAVIEACFRISPVALDNNAG